MNAVELLPAQFTVVKANGGTAPVQPAVVTLPYQFAWLAQFEADELAEFLEELMAALQPAEASGDWLPVAEVIESWKATANMLASPETRAGIAEGLRELETEDGVEWDNLAMFTDPALVPSPTSPPAPRTDGSRPRQAQSHRARPAV